MTVENTLWMHSPNTGRIWITNARVQPAEQVNQSSLGAQSHSAVFALIGFRQRHSTTTTETFCFDDRRTSVLDYERRKL